MTWHRRCLAGVDIHREEAAVMLQLRCMTRFSAAPGFMVCVVLLGITYSEVHAFTVIVPDDRPSIQAALDDGADSVRVRSGFYPERLEIRRSVTIVQFPAPTGFGYAAVALPRAGRLMVKESYEGQCTVIIRGVRFTGPVVLDRKQGSSMYLTFESCRMDSGLYDTPGSFGYLGILMLNVQGCTILKGANVRPYAVNFNLNTVIGGGVEVFGEGFSTVRGNFVQGPAEVGIRSRGESADVSDNTIVGTDLGIDCRWFVGHAERNEVMDCTGAGISIARSGSAIGNIVRRCGGEGLTIGVAATASGNVIEEAGGAGIRMTDGSSQAMNNIITRCAGPGILAETGASVTGNTIYRNQGAGIVARAGGEIRRNIAFSNGGAGLEWSPPYPPILECNDWFGNARGAVRGATRSDGPGPTDLAVDPLFCDVAGGDVHLRADSPLLDAPGCGLIGALGQGCVAASAIPDAGGEAQFDAAELRVAPLPSREGVRLSWRPLTTPARLEVFDAAGARRWGRELPAGQAGFHWSGTDEVGRRLPAGVYFARLLAPGVARATRVVLTE